MLPRPAAPTSARGAPAPRGPRPGAPRPARPRAASRTAARPGRSCGCRRSGRYTSGSRHRPPRRRTPRRRCHGPGGRRRSGPGSPADRRVGLGHERPVGLGRDLEVAPEAPRAIPSASSQAAWARPSHPSSSASRRAGERRLPGGANVRTPRSRPNPLAGRVVQRLAGNFEADPLPEDRNVAAGPDTRVRRQVGVGDRPPDRVASPPEVTRPTTSPPTRTGSLPRHTARGSSRTRHRSRFAGRRPGPRRARRGR